MTTFYGYSKCSTCRAAKHYLEKHGVAFKEVDITRNPPPKRLLQSILKSGTYTITDLLNRSGLLYRELNMKDKVKTMTESALLDLLAKKGKLLKRPVITDGKRHTVGFDQVQIKRVWFSKNK